MKQNNYCLSILRIIACFFVIVSHTSIFAKEIAYEHSIIEWSVINFYHILSRIAVPIFFMISGFLYLNKERTYKDMICKTITRLVLPLTICSAVIYFKNNPTFDINNIIKFIKALLTCDIIGSYWFIYTIAGIYLITPLLQKLIKVVDKKDIIVYGIYCIIIMSIIPVLEHYGLFKSSNYFNIPLVSTYVFYYIIGYYVLSNSFVITKTRNLITGIVSIICIIVGVILCYCDRKIFNLDYSIYSMHSSFTVLIPSLWITYNIRILFSKIRISEICKKIINSVSSTTFCIYMIHVVFLGSTEFVFKYIMNEVGIAIFPALLIYNLILFGGLVILGLIIKKIPIIKKIF